MPGGQPRTGVPAKRLGSKARCDALLAELQRMDDLWTYFRSRFVLTAGYTKDSPGEPTVGAEESIAQQMRYYLLSRDWTLSCVMQGRVWGTFEETKEAIRLIAYSADTNWASDVKIYVSTNLGHLPRVWLCWLFLKPEGWKVHFVTAKHSFTLKEYFQETGKFFIYLYRFLFRRW